MQLTRPLVAVALAVTLASCAVNPGPTSQEGSLAGQAKSTFPPQSTTDEVVEQVTYVVPDSMCPVGWVGLEVTTDGDGGLGDLDDIVACTDKTAQRTYLENHGRVVWLLSAATVTPSTAVPIRLGPGEASFRRIVRQNRGQEAMAPGSAMVANVPPAEVSWTPDLPLTYGWEGLGLTVTKLQSIGGLFALAALAGQNKAGDALVNCTLAIDKYAASVDDLAGVSPANVVVTGLGSNRCRTAAARAGVADEIAGARSETRRLEVLAANLRSAADSSRALPNGAQLLPH